MIQNLKPNRFAAGLFVRRFVRSFALTTTAALLLAGCHSPRPTPLFEADLKRFESIKLQEGDTVLISFPGSPNLNASQQIRRDGKIQLPLAGEMHAAGLTPSELEKEILKVYGPQLVLKEVTVTIQSAAYPVFVTGAVVKPGKIMADRPLTALEAVMEAGGFDLTRANMKAVTIVRRENDKLQHYVLNLKEVLEGKSKQMFYLRPSDIIYVPEKRF